MESLESRLQPGDALFGPAASAARLGTHPAADQDAAATSAPLAGTERRPALGGEGLWQHGDTTTATPATIHEPSDRAERPPTVIFASVGQAPPWESSGAPRPMPVLPPPVSVSAGHGFPDAAAAGLILAQAAGLVHQDVLLLAGEKDQLLQIAGTQHSGAGVQSSGVQALFDLDQPTTGPFPSNVFTAPDRTHNTGRRVNLPLPDCKVYVSDCEDLAVLNELDGFNLQPRLSIPFSGPIDVNSVTSETVFLVSLGSTVPGQGTMPRGTVVGINQVVWDVETHTLHVESDELLAQHTRFALLVTNGIRDADGDPVRASPEFRRFRDTAPPAYRRELENAIQVARRLGVSEWQMVTASVFTTQSATAVLEKIRDQIKAGTPKPADFLLGPKGERAVFALDGVTGVTWRQQTQVEPPAFNAVNLNLSLLRNIYPGAVGGLAFGKFLSPDYQVHPGEYIPAVGTRTGTPAVQGVNEVYFNLVLPSGPKPANGWPVAIYVHGGGGNKNAALLSVAASLARQGIATAGINSVGSGFGPLGTLTVASPGSAIAVSDGGRGRDWDGDRVIDASEGMSAAAPRNLLGNRDGFRQTAVDLMQLVRVIEVGVDVDGDKAADLDSARTYYFGTSQGGNIGTLLLAVEPRVQAGVPNVPGSPLIDNDRLAPSRRASVGTRLAARVPPLLNAPGITSYGGVSVPSPHFHDNLPLRDGVPLAVRLADETDLLIQSPVSNTVAGAMPIQEFVDRTEWVFQSGNSVAHAPHLRRAPLPGVPAKSVIVQFAKGDLTNPNPVTTAIVRAGHLADRATFYRHDLAYAEDPTLPTNPHGFMPTLGNVAWRAIVLGAQSQIATFFASDGKEVIHPEPARFFESPIQGPLPEELNYLS